MQRGNPLPVAAICKTVAGAGEGIRTLDPDLGKVGLMCFLVLSVLLLFAVIRRY
jgi:hypothetical protein